MLKEIYKEAKDHMEKAVAILHEHLAGLRTGRANPELIAHLKVDYYGSEMPLNQLASITAPDARTLVVQAWDRNALPTIEKAIREADLGLNPSTKGDAIYISIPPLTEERRKALVKTAHQMAEEARIAIRNVRRNALEKLRKYAKEAHMPEDEERRAEGEIQKLTDTYIEKVNELLAKKESEILGD